MTGGIRHTPSHTNVCKFFNFQLTFSQLILHLICWKLCRVTKVKVLFLVLVYVFNFNLFEFSAAILKKGLFPPTSYHLFFVHCWQKLYEVPPYSKEIPYTRVNHNKYMVTESVAYIGTSNWSADYFVNTGGIGYVINETDTGDTVRARLQAVFERNWNSTYTTPLYCKD